MSIIHNTYRKTKGPWKDYHSYQELALALIHSMMMIERGINKCCCSPMARIRICV